MAKAKRTAADIAAAVKIGAIAPDAVVLTEAEAEAATSSVVHAVNTDAERRIAATRDAIRLDERRIAATRAAVNVATPIDSTTHQCGIPGCTHGTIRNGHATQPDRQVKIACLKCGAVARMTAKAIHTAGGMPVCADGGQFAMAPRRTYSRRGQ